MDNRVLYLVLTLILVGLLVGAVGFGSDILFDRAASESATATPENDEEGHEPLQEAEIDIIPQFYNESGNKTLPVNVDVTVRGYPEFTYEDVQLCLYDSDGRILDQRTIGEVRSLPDDEYIESYRLTTRPNELPTYIVADHPRLRNDSRFRIQLRYWEDGDRKYTYEPLDEIQHDFEWPRSNETGVCG